MIHILLISLFTLLQSPNDCSKMPEIREKYGNIQSEQELINFIDLLETVDCIKSGPYLASATMQKAQFAIAPWTKYNYFRKGKKHLEEFIEKYPDNIEARYVRFLVQTHAPFFLGYNNQVHSDADFIRSNIDEEDLSIAYRNQMINHINTLENK